jgi:hypothetical protein
MRLPSEYKTRRALAAATGFGIVALSALSLVLIFSPFLNQPQHAQAAQTIVHVKADPSPSEFFRGAMAAMQETMMLPVMDSSQIVGADSRLNNYRLERESCCVGN